MWRRHLFASIRILWLSGHGRSVVHWGNIFQSSALQPVPTIDRHLKEGGVSFRPRASHSLSTIASCAWMILRLV